MPGRIESQTLIAPEVIERALLQGLANARARGAPWQPLAEEYLDNVEQILKNIQMIRVDMLRRHAAPARVMAEMNEKVLALLERLADAVWVARGQQPQDPFISILSPGTPNFFFDWNIGRPVDRLEVLLELISIGQSSTPRNPDVAGILAELRSILSDFRGLNEAVRAFRAQLEVLEKFTEIVTRIGHVQYSRLRRRMRAEGFDSFEVREVFPDIPGASISGTLS